MKLSVLPGLNCTTRPQILPRTGTESLTTAIQRLRVPRQRLQSILSTNSPFTLLVPSLTSSPELSAALRIAHALQLFHALDAQIVSVSEIETARGAPMEGNLVVIGCAEAPLVRRWLEHAGGTWAYTDGAWHFGSARFERPSSGEAISFPFGVLAGVLTSPVSCQRSCFANHTRTICNVLRSSSSRQTQRASNAPFGSSRFARACSRPTGSSSTVVQT